MIDGLKPYGEYRETGEPLVGRVPKHWETRRTKTLFHERVEKGHPEEPLLAATQSKGVVRKSEYGARTVTVTKDFHLLKLVEVGDYVISLRSFEGGLEVCHERGIISPAYTVLEPSADASSGYFTKFFKSSQFVGGLTLFVTGIREGQNIDYERLSRAYVPLPPPEEQAAIVRFLTWAHRRLDKVVANKRRTIALLNEQKQAIIHRAVTRGLDPNVKLKPSGIPWLGEIPEGWEVARNLALFSNRVEPGTPELPVLQVSLHTGVSAEDLDQFGRKKRLIGDRSKYKVVRKNDLAYNTMRMWQGAVGVAPVDGLVSPAYVVVRPRSGANPDFYELVFRTEVYKNYVNQFSTGIVPDRNRLYWDNFKQLTNLLVPPGEQVAICAKITELCRGPDVTISRLEREIELLVEYRTRLTADVVTGQLDVRQAAAGLPDEVAVVEERLEDDELAHEEGELDA